MGRLTADKQERSLYPCDMACAHTCLRVPLQLNRVHFVLILSNWHRARPCNKTVVCSGQGKAKALTDNEEKTTSFIPSPPLPGNRVLCDRLQSTKQGSSQKRCFKYSHLTEHTCTQKKNKVVLWGI